MDEEPDLATAVDEYVKAVEKHHKLYSSKNKKHKKGNTFLITISPMRLNSQSYLEQFYEKINRQGILYWASTEVTPTSEDKNHHLHLAICEVKNQNSLHEGEKYRHDELLEACCDVQVGKDTNVNTTKSFTNFKNALQYVSKDCPSHIFSNHHLWRDAFIPILAKRAEEERKQAKQDKKEKQQKKEQQKNDKLERLIEILTSTTACRPYRCFEEFFLFIKKQHPDLLNASNQYRDILSRLISYYRFLRLNRKPPLKHFRVMVNHPVLQEYLDKFVELYFHLIHGGTTPHTTRRRNLWIWGSTRTGKSTFLKLLKTALNTLQIPDNSEFFDTFYDFYDAIVQDEFRGCLFHARGGDAMNICKNLCEHPPSTITIKFKNGREFKLDYWRPLIIASQNSPEFTFANSAVNRSGTFTDEDLAALEDRFVVIQLSSKLGWLDQTGKRVYKLECSFEIDDQTFTNRDVFDPTSLFAIENFDVGVEQFVLQFDMSRAEKEQLREYLSAYLDGERDENGVQIGVSHCPPGINHETILKYIRTQQEKITKSCANDDADDTKYNLLLNKRFENLKEYALKNGIEWESAMEDEREAAEKEGYKLDDEFSNNNIESEGIELAGEEQDEESIEIEDTIANSSGKAYKFTEVEVQKYRRERFLALKPLELTQLNGTDFRMGAEQSPESIDKFLQQQEREIDSQHSNSFENIPNVEHLVTNLRSIDGDVQIARSLRNALYHFGYGREAKPPPMEEMFDDFLTKYKEYVKSKVPFRYVIKFLHAFCEFVTVILMYNQS